MATSNKIICNHIFFHSKKIEQLSFCKLCGCMKYLDDISCKSPELKHYCEIDLTEIFYNSFLARNITEKINYNDPCQKSYLMIRRQGIKMIKRLCQQLKLSNKTCHAAIYYMDLIFLKDSNQNIEVVFPICVLLAAKFSENEQKGFNLEKQLFGSKYDRMRIKHLESHCLKLLDYDMSQFTAFDILHFLVSNGIVFTSEYKGDTKRIYSCIVEKVDQFVEDDRFMDFSRVEVAFAIIAIAREEMHLPVVPYQFEKIYNVKFHNFKNCYFILKMLYQSCQPVKSYTKIINAISYPAKGKKEKRSCQKMAQGYLNQGRFTYNNLYKTIDDSFEASTLDNSASITSDNYLGLKASTSRNAFNLKLNLVLDGNTMNNSNEYPRSSDNYQGIALNHKSQCQNEISYFHESSYQFNKYSLLVNTSHSTLNGKGISQSFNF